MIPKTFAFQCRLNTQIGVIPVHDGDNIEVRERGDGLWNVILNDVRIPYAVVSDDVNKLAGQRLIGVVP